MDFKSKIKYYLLENKKCVDNNEPPREQISIYISKPIADMLVDIRRVTGVPTAFYIRQAIVDYTKNIYGIEL